MAPPPSSSWVSCAQTVCTAQHCMPPPACSKAKAQQGDEAAQARDLATALLAGIHRRSSPSSGGIRLGSLDGLLCLRAAGEMLHVAEPFLERNLHPTVIVRGFRRALEDAVKVSMHPFHCDATCARNIQS